MTSRLWTNTWYPRKLSYLKMNNDQNKQTDDHQALKWYQGEIFAPQIIDFVLSFLLTKCTYLEVGKISSGKAAEKENARPNNCIFTYFVGVLYSGLSTEQSEIECWKIRKTGVYRFQTFLLRLSLHRLMHSWSWYYSKWLIMMDLLNESLIISIE